MTDIKYHPLIDADTDGKTKVPMFCSDNRDNMNKHLFYLEEMTPHHFRLCSTEAVPAESLADLDIRCPSCGRSLRIASLQTDGTRHALYLCDNCR